LINRVEEAERRIRAGGGGGVVPARPTSAQGTLLDTPARSSQPLSPQGRGQGEGTHSAPAAPAQPLTPTLSPEGRGSSAGDLGEAWQRVVAGVLARKALLGSVLQHATPIAVRDGAVAIDMVASRFHQELLADRANRELIHQVIAEHVPGARRLALEAEAAPATGAAAHPAVRAAVAAFGGEVVAVRPRMPDDPETQEGEGQ
jgi:hypothetical protein